ncbi:hypothetical protein TEA_019008 [Camellia sinensis var. sinensis]|uniref:Glycosyl transferase 48 domain-containing protein n=1 Tax=Camellia sinensis var. sinensis TaxID=542762 RepID=A0A4S4D058_CAMSN|nr:hypothetical protein TEA_019008 [Camellia sinensis var. sinensis]
MAPEGLFPGEGQRGAVGDYNNLKYPKLEDMLDYILKQQPALLEATEMREAKLLFPSKTYVAMIKFLLKCFEADAEQYRTVERILEYWPSVENMCLLLEHAMAYEGSVELHSNASKALITIGTYFQEVPHPLFSISIVKKEVETPELKNGAVKAIQDLYDVVRLDVLNLNMREHYETWNMLSKARNEGRLFINLNWPRDAELNLEARRRLEFFTNSLFMDMPPAKPVREMLSFSVFTPYYSETVLYSMDELLKKNEDGISILFYLQKIYPDEWQNFLARIGRDENAIDSELFDNPSDILELQFWASYRGQTLARTGPLIVKGRNNPLRLSRVKPILQKPIPIRNIQSTKFPKQKLNRRNDTDIASSNPRFLFVSPLRSFTSEGGCFVVRRFLSPH